MVMEKFRAAIEEGGLVFIALDDEFLASAEAVTAIAEIRRDTADEKIRPPSCHLENPSQHRRCRGFSVRAGDHDRAVLRYEKFFDDFRHRAIRNLFVQDVFELGIAARNHVADY